MNAVAADPFTASRQRFEDLCVLLGEQRTGELEHAELETRLDDEGRALLRQLMQDHLELRAEREQRLPAVHDADAVAHTLVESGHRRGLVSIFGEVRVRRLAYRARGRENLYPADAGLNLPAERHSHGLRRLAAIEAARGSFDAALEAVARATGVAPGKRQVEQLAARAACDVTDFYADRPPAPSADTDVLVLSCDGKGIVMRPEALRPATARAAARAGPKLATRLSKGEKRNRKRMAELGTVYDLTPAPRIPADIFPDPDDDEARPPVPTPSNKWLVASVVDDAASVVGQIFDEACRRDPDHARTWVALVDGNNHQLDRIRSEAAARGVTVSVVIDFIHVLEYLSAPRGAVPYPLPSRERLEECLWV